LMDPFERAPWNYGRDAVVVTASGSSQPVSAWTYFANTAFRQPGLLPSAAYLAHLLAGDDFLPPAYVAWLAAWQDRDPGAWRSGAWRA
ncbi:MAG: hypothetical protein AAF513_17600, partial [Pseudomonadota bacterium]